MHPPPTQAASGSNVSGVHLPTLIFGLLQGAAWVALVLQFCIEPSLPNVSAAALACGSSALTFLYLQRTGAFHVLPISAFALLGLCVTTQWGALVAQSLTWTPISEHLWDGIRTFGWLGLFQCVAVAAHWLVRQWRFYMSARDVLAGGLARLGLFAVPSPGNLWFMGVVGLFAMLATGTANDTGAGTKFVAGLTFLTWAPFIVPVLHVRYGAAYCSIRPQMVAVVLYFAAVALVGLALNSRAVPFAGLVTALLLSLLLALSSAQPSRLPKMWKLVLGALLCTLVVMFAGDLATAMAIARKDRGNASLATMVQETLYALADRKVLEVYRDAGELSAQTSTYSEAYIANPALARFVETKFHDNLFHLMQGLRPVEVAELQKVTSDRLWGILPKPVLTVIGVDLDKEAEQAFSLGDFFDYLKNGNPLGGFKTGSIFAHGLALFPFTFPFIYFAMCVLLFLLWDMLARQVAPVLVEISPLAMLYTYKLFMYGITSESLTNTASFAFRGIWQLILLYVLVLMVSKIFFRTHSHGIGGEVCVGPTSASAKSIHVAPQ